MKRFFKAVGVLVVYGLIMDGIVLLVNYVKKLINKNKDSKVETQ